ncbi:FecR domain-containing protein [Chitinophaga sp. 212800010-3]|uniref:FecR family protein n=1 Tax=unclassified Chitinophaga TaxID=2619133 RepID=UPI002DF64E2B|nr:FecR domain-containing protein [Chitinophaga sp. 212800010-3]
METAKIRRLLKKYLLGESQAEDNKAIERWYQSFDEEAMPVMDDLTRHRIRQEIWSGIHPQIVVAKTFYLRRNLMRVAAAVLALVATGSTWYLIAHRRPAVNYTTYTTRIGERKTIHLNDGSVLMLNAGSTIRVPDNMAISRQLNLVDGEVFFDVRTNPEVPFIVESGPLQTTVLGTSFNIAAYKGVHTLSIGVVSGKVQVAGEKQATRVLEHDQELVYDKASEKISITSVEESLAAWQNGKLVFNDLSFADMVILMEKNFGITITTARDEVRSTRYTTELPTNMEPVKAVQVLAAIHHLNVRSINVHAVVYE